MSMYPQSLRKLIDCFKMLPGVGEKTAERYALLVTDMNPEKVQNFADALVEVRNNLHHCKTCGNLCEGDECEICADTERDHALICVVASPKDVIAMEKTGEYKGVYHVLNGLISTTKGIMPEDLNLQTLLERAEHAREIILATNTTLEGETTAMYLNKLLASQYPDLLITRIAHGLPSGGLLDYADEMTLAHAMSDRRKM